MLADRLQTHTRNKRENCTCRLLTLGKWLSYEVFGLARTLCRVVQQPDKWLGCLIYILLSAILLKNFIPKCCYFSTPAYLTFACSNKKGKDKQNGPKIAFYQGDKHQVHMQDKTETNNKPHGMAAKEFCVRVSVSVYSCAKHFQTCSNASAGNTVVV